jgi:serine/threonine protein kinase
VQMRGIFMDSMMGMSAIHGVKMWKLVYPVIVMEFIDGGALYDRVHRNKFMSEKILKQMFTGFLMGLKGIHSRGFVHRDLKLENIMLTACGDTDVHVKIIDLGMMVHLSAGETKHHSDKICGTRGYMAPESLLRKEYSIASDLWQVGCVLYSMLSGLLPFHPDHLEQSYRGEYYPMTGPVWAGISDTAKDLIKRLLVVNPDWRLPLDRILEHKWLTTEAPDVNLGPSYALRIKSLALRHKMRNFFMVNEELLTQTRISPEQLNDLLPFLKVRGKGHYESEGEGGDKGLPSVVGFGMGLPREDGLGTLPALSPRLTDTTSASGSASGGGSPRQELRRAESVINVSHDISVRTFKLRLHDVQELLVGRDLQSIQEVSSDKSLGAGADRRCGGKGTTDSEDEEERGRGRSGKGNKQQQQRHSFTLPAGEIDFESFVDVLTRAGLKALATPSVFNLFDIGSKGTSLHLTSPHLTYEVVMNIHVIAFTHNVSILSLLISSICVWH